MQAKARCVLAWLCEETIDIAKNNVGDPWMPLMASCVLLGVHYVMHNLGDPKHSLSRRRFLLWNGVWIVHDLFQGYTTLRPR